MTLALPKEIKMTLSKMILILLVTFSSTLFQVSPTLSGRNNFERENLSVEKQYPAVTLRKGNVDTDRDFDEGNQSAAGIPEEPDTDRPGGDYRNFRSPGGAASCREACEKDSRCRSYTFVKPGYHGEEGRCFLKSSVPAPKKNRCCISGIKKDIPVVVTKKLSQPTVQITKPQNTKPLSQNVQPVLTPRLQAFRQSVLKNIQELKTREKVLLHERIRRANEEIRFQSEFKSKDSFVLACSMPQITSVSPSQISPGSKILIKGCGFSEIQRPTILYDPTGKWLIGAGESDNSSKTIDKNSAPIGIEKWSDTEIHGFIIRPQLLFEPRKVHIRIKWGNQWSNPSPEINLEPNYDYYVCNQFPDCTPVYIHPGGNKGATTIVSPGGVGETATIYHMSGGGGVDTLVENMKLPKFFTFVQVWLTPEPLKLTPGGNWEPAERMGGYVLDVYAKIEQNLDDIEGKTFLPKVTVKWSAPMNCGISYSYAIILRGPEGWGDIPF